MRVFSSVLDKDVIDILTSGGVVVARTDTIYGILAKANDDQAVERVYALKKRDQNKSPIVLISGRDMLFDETSNDIDRLLDEAWPGPVSVILPSSKAPRWLSRDNHSVAYRLPADDRMSMLIEKVGPLVALSANIEGMTPAKTIEDAFEYFGDKVDAYVDGGEVEDNTPSRLLQVNDSGEVEYLR